MGERVEYSVFKDGNGRLKAENVTGPMGTYVQGVSQMQQIYDENNFGRDGGYGSGGRDGYGRDNGM